MSSARTAVRAALADPALAALPGPFHAHLTVDAEADALPHVPHARATVIDLGGRPQRDPMLTVDGADLANLVQRILTTMDALDAAGVPVARVKIEQGGRPTLPTLSPERYAEAHLKLRIPRAGAEATLAHLRAAASEHGFALSRNPREQTADALVQFVNLRVYTGTIADADARVDAVTAWLTAQGLPPAEVRRETTILDTARARDAWWA